jgi:hypothetical protein
MPPVVTTSFIQIVDLGMKALVFNRFKDIMNLVEESQDCVLYPKEIAQRKIAEKRGEGTVEFISLWRDGTKFAWERQRSPVSRHGMYMEFETEDKHDIIQVTAVPADLEYNIWFWSKSLEVLQQVAEKYMFWQHRDPNLALLFADRYNLELDLHFGALIDESSLPEAFEKGEYFVLKAPIKVDGWVFEAPFDVKTILKIHVAIFDSLGQVPVLLAEWWVNEHGRIYV